MTYEEAEKLLLETHRRDPEAAEWLLNTQGARIEIANDLGAMFVWSESPQGGDFWSAIANVVFPEWDK